MLHYVTPVIGLHAKNFDLIMSRHHQLKAAEEEIKMNISPLIDMVFILLIFFIVTTVFVDEQGLGVNKPEPTAEAKAMENDTIVFTILNSGQIFFGKNEIGINAVRAKISELTRKEKLPVIIEVDNAAPSGTMVRIMDEATLAGAEAISLINLKAGQ